ncbi:transposase [Serratia sp. M24T3]|nr:transposase [Serratia sp. M24T3]
MTKNTRFSPEVRQRAVRMVIESQNDYDSLWAAISSIAPKIGCTPETLRMWLRQYERDAGSGDGGLTTAERQHLKNWSGKFVSCAAATISCARLPRICEGGVRPPVEKITPLVDILRGEHGVGPVCHELESPRRHITGISSTAGIRTNAASGSSVTTF